MNPESEPSQGSGEETGAATGLARTGSRDLRTQGGGQSLSLYFHSASDQRESLVAFLKD